MKKAFLYFITALFFINIVGCSQNSMISQKEAEQKALEAINGEIISHVENFEDEKPNYLFIIVKEDTYYEIKIHRKTGEVISQIVVDDNEEIQHANSDLTSDTLLTEEQAKQMALEKVGGGNIVKTELVNNDGQKRYNIEIQYNDKEYRIEIDAIAKEIIAYSEQ